MLLTKAMQKQSLSFTPWKVFLHYAAHDNKETFPSRRHPNLGQGFEMLLLIILPDYCFNMWQFDMYPMMCLRAALVSRVKEN